MKMTKFLLPFFVLGFLFTSCSKDDDDVKPGEPPVESENLEVENFIYKGLNDIYLYKADVPALADEYFSDKEAKSDFLKSYDNPEALFDGLLYKKEDRFSFLMDDYIALENLFAGVQKTTGMEYSLGRISATNKLFGVVWYVLPGTSAEAEGVKRGDIFTSINGEDLTEANYQELFASSTVEIDINLLREIRSPLRMKLLL